METAPPSEPLFSLTNDKTNPTVSFELRTEAFGYGHKVLKHANIAMNDIEYCTHWIIGKTLLKIGRSKTGYAGEDTENLSYRRLLTAGLFLFDIKDVNINIIKKLHRKPFRKALMSKVNHLALSAILFAFAHVHEDNLEQFRHLPLSLQQCNEIKRSEHNIPKLESPADRTSCTPSEFGFP